MARLTELKRQRMLKRAATLHSKAVELFIMAEEIFGSDDNEWLPYFGDTMCSADELQNVLTAIPFQAGRAILADEVRS